MRTAWSDEPCEHTPNSLGRKDKRKIEFDHKQLNPSMIGMFDLIYFPKDVGRSGMISPWADISKMKETDINKYPNIKFKLFEFIQREFPNKTLRFDCDNIVDYNKILDKLVMSAYINVEYFLPKADDDDSGGDK